MRSDLTFDLRARVVGRSPLDEDQLGPGAESRCAFDALPDQPGLVPARYDNRDAELSAGRRRLWPRDDPPRKAQVTQPPQPRGHAVQEGREQRNPPWKEDLPSRRDHLEIRKL